MSDTQPTRSIEIPERTAVELSRRLSRTEFESIDDYATFALNQLLEELDRGRADSETRPDLATLDDAPPEEAIENRLESLGYL